MKALVYTNVETLEFRDVADPKVADQDHLIRIDSVGICGSDMHAYLGHDNRRPVPLILGHEAAGEIVGGPMDGTRITINPLVTCGACPACIAGRDNLCSTRQIISMPPREGAFAQFITMPERNLVPVPDDMTLEKAALAEPVAVGWHAIRLGLDALAGDRADTALVIGGGAIGVAAAISLIAQGVTNVTIVEPNALRRDYLNLGANITVLAPDQIKAQLFAMTVDCVGYDATRATSCAVTRPGGVILHVGLGSGTSGLDVRRMTLQEIGFIGSYTYTAQDFRDTCAAMFGGRLGPLDWIETRPLSDGARAFKEIREGLIAAPKILKPA